MYLSKNKSNIGLALLIFIGANVFYAQSKSNAPFNQNNWYRSYLISTSKNGKWMHYTKNYPDGTSTASIQNLDTSQTFEFYNESWGEFSRNSKWFALPSVSNSLIVVDLIQGVVDTLPNVNIKYFSHAGDHLITQSVEDSLKFIDLDDNGIYNAGKSSDYVVNPLKNIVATVSSNSENEALKIFDLETFQSFDIMPGPNYKFTRLNWDSKGNNLTFLFSLDSGKTYNIGFLNLKNRSVRILKDQAYLENHQVSIANAKLSISDTGDKVFFYVNPLQKDADVQSEVEVWDTFDPVLYSRKQFVNSGKKGPWVYVWHPNDNKLVPLATMEMPQVIFNPNSNYALNFDAYAREPQFNSNPFVDIYVIDIKSGKKKLVVANQFIGINFVHFSPEGKYFAYFNDNNWWLYNIQTQRNVNITLDIPATFKNDKSYSFSTPEPYGLVGWTKNEDALFLYDEFDIWKINLITQKKEKLTGGRNSKTVYRIVKGPNDLRTNYGDLGFESLSIDDKEGLMLSAKNQRNLEMGFYKLNDAKDIRPITWQDRRLSNLHRLDPDKFLYEKQSFNEPTSFELMDLKTGLQKTVFKSNPEWNQFKWPNKQLITYNTQINDSLKGFLIYPIEYDSSKKYPMIVHVYEEQASDPLSYTPPSDLEDRGFNYMSYALNGYFVLLPDIQYWRNAPGISATACVEKAVEKALEVASIDSKRIGLIGHSFGGYETAFIITQNDMFATAVVGSGMFNLVSYYLDIYKMTGQTEMMRVENVQYRMKDSFFENPEAYEANSPLYHAANINTPIMIWAGREDINVNPNQSLQGYLALRRLRKPAVLYYYKGEDHVLNKNENKIDLTNKIMKWFDSYLK